MAKISFYTAGFLKLGRHPSHLATLDKQVTLAIVMYDYSATFPKKFGSSKNN